MGPGSPPWVSRTRGAQRPAGGEAAPVRAGKEAGGDPAAGGGRSPRVAGNGRVGDKRPKPTTKPLKFAAGCWLSVVYLLLLVVGCFLLMLVFNHQAIRICCCLLVAAFFWMLLVVYYWLLAILTLKAKLPLEVIGGGSFLSAPYWWTGMTVRATRFMVVETIRIYFSGNKAPHQVVGVSSFPGFNGFHPPKCLEMDFVHPEYQRFTPCRFLESAWRE